MADGVGTWRRSRDRRTAGSVALGRGGVAVAALALALGGLGLSVPGGLRLVAAASPGDTVRPVPGEVVAEFDPPDRPYGPGRRGARLAADTGELVRAARGGTVVFAGSVAGTPWVSVDHGGGLRTSYGPVDPRVRAGERVAAGDPLGRLTGEGGGLHWGARVDGAYIDPLGLLHAWRPVLVPRDDERPG